MPNPGGKNVFTPQPQYGEVQKQAQLTREAPMSGAPTPAVNAPAQAQQAAQRPVSAPKAMPAAGSPPDYPVELAAQWAQIAALPGASPLIKSIAQRAAMQAGMNGS